MSELWMYQMHGLYLAELTAVVEHAINTAREEVAELQVLKSEVESLGSGASGG